MEKENNSFKIIGYCLFAAIVMITICSKSSIIYPLNDWGDANCYYTIGKGIKHGLIPYRDLYDQKGIFVFFMYFIAALISEQSFFGVYIIEIVSATLFLFFSYKTASLYKEISGYSLAMIMILASASFSSASFCHGGSAEELMLPVFAYGIYLSSRQFEKRSLPDPGEMFLFGICSAVLFYSKFTLCILLMTIIAFMIIDAIHCKEFGNLLKTVPFYLLGILLISVLIITYFCINNSFEYFYDGYFYKNIFETMGEKNTSGAKDFELVLNSVGNYFRKRNVLTILLNFLGLAWLLKSKKKMAFWCYVFSFVLLFYIQFMTLAPQKYYGLPLSVFGALGICFVVELLERIKTISCNAISIVAIIFSILVSFVFTDNRYFMFADKNETPQIKFAKEMNQLEPSDYNLLYYGALDEGYYLACNKLPNCRAFIQTNLPGDYLANLQYEHIDNKKLSLLLPRKYSAIIMTMI